MKISKPLTQEQLKQGDLIEPGIYDFEVIAAEDTVSKSGNDMLKLQLKVWDKNGRERMLFDYLLEALEWKVGHFCEATGLLAKYQAGEFDAADCFGKSGQCKVYIQISKDPAYSDKNAIADYMPTDDIAAAKLAKKEADIKQSHPEFDEDLPF